MNPCPVCAHYSAVRGKVLAPAIRETAARTGEHVKAIRRRFMAGVHDRHRSGLPVLPKAAS